MREIIEAVNRKRLDEAAKKKAPGGGIKINKEVLPRHIGGYLSEYFWQDLEYNLAQKNNMSPEDAQKLVQANKSKIEEVISKMAANTNFSISPKLEGEGIDNEPINESKFSFSKITKEQLKKAKAEVDSLKSKGEIDGGDASDVRGFFIDLADSVDTAKSTYFDALDSLTRDIASKVYKSIS